MEFRAMVYFDSPSLCRSTPAQRLSAALALVLCCGDALAALGHAPLPGALAIVARPAPVTATAPGAKLQAAARPGAFTAHESVLDTGTTVTEFATPAGVVFAVSWRGPVLPDLNSLLGGYFKAFRDEAQQSRAAGRRGSPMTVVTDALVVNSTGRMRNFSGWAYAPGLMPAAVNIKDVLQ